MRQESSLHYTKKLGHEVMLIPPFIVKPFVIGNKNDHNDTIGIGEASFRPNIRLVNVKPVEQQDIQSLCHKTVIQQSENRIGL